MADQQRRPVMRRLGPLVAAAAVVASATTAGGTAHAVNWDVIADCESGGNWHALNGGGLQIKPQTWWSNGGIALPELAPKAEQIRVANNIMASQGAKAWPKCSAAPGAMSPGSIGDFFNPPKRQGSCWLLLRCH